MAGSRIQIGIDDREAIALIKKYVARGRNPAPILKSIGEYMVLETEKRFEGEHDPQGRPWAPLKLRTIYGSHRGKKYTKKGKLTKRFSTYVARRKILTRSGRMRGSVAYKTGHDFVQVGSNVIYFATHQFGDDSRNIPERASLGVNEDNRREFVQIIKDHVLQEKI